MIFDAPFLQHPDLRHVRDAVQAFSRARGALSADQRRALAEEAVRQAQGQASDPEPEEPCDTLERYARKVARYAYRVVDEDVDAIRAGASEDAIFEATIAAGLGASLARLERGLALLDDPPADQGDKR